MASAGREIQREELRKVLGKIKHDINNPVSVIAGNAQFLRELVRSEGLGELFAESLDDIEAACEKLAGILDRLDNIEDELEASGGTAAPSAS